MDEGVLKEMNIYTKTGAGEQLGVDNNCAGVVRVARSLGV